MPYARDFLSSRLSILLIFLISLLLGPRIVAAQFVYSELPRANQVVRKIVFFRNFLTPTAFEVKNPGAYKKFLVRQRLNSQSRLTDYLYGLSQQGIEVQFRSALHLNFMIVETNETVLAQLPQFQEVAAVEDDDQVTMIKPIELMQPASPYLFSATKSCARSPLSIHSAAEADPSIAASLYVSQVFSPGLVELYSSLNFPHYAIFSYLRSSQLNSLCHLELPPLTQFSTASDHPLLSEVLNLIDNSLDPDLNYSTNDQPYFQLLTWTYSLAISQNQLFESVCNVLSQTLPVTVFIAPNSAPFKNPNFLQIPHSCEAVLQADYEVKLSELDRLLAPPLDGNILSKTAASFPFKQAKKINRILKVQPQRVGMVFNGVSYVYGGLIIDSLVALQALSISYSKYPSLSLVDYLEKIRDRSKGSNYLMIEE